MKDKGQIRNYKENMMNTKNPLINIIKFKETMSKQP